MTTDYDVLQVVAVSTVAIIVGAVPHMAVGQPPRLESLARRVLVAGLAALLFRPLYTRSCSEWITDGGWQLPALMLVIVLVCGVVDALLAAAGARRSREHAVRGGGARRVPRAARDRLGHRRHRRPHRAGRRGHGLLGTAALRAAAARGAVLVPAVREHPGDVRQTIRALSRVTEVGGYTETRSRPTGGALSVAVGREMGLSEADLDDLEYAALMHDIGQLSLTDPISGGATVMVARDEQRRIAELGAEVIRQTGVMDRVAHIVEQQAEPFRRPGQPFDASVPVASRIIRVVNAYDDLVGGSMDTDRRIAALDRLRLGVAYEYDPHVVDSSVVSSSAPCWSTSDDLTATP